MKLTKKKKLILAGFGVLLAGACVSMMMPGCWRTRAANLVAVSGRVMIDGRPLTIGTVAFQPDLSRGNSSKDLPMGSIDENGAYELFTVGKPGAAPGWYKVLVYASEPSSGPGRAGQFPANRSLVHAKYTDLNQTDLAIEIPSVPDGGMCDLNLQR
jgi:hypothetical protein